MGYQSQLRKDSFLDQVIIVTGGGSGIGRCIAHELSGLGARVALVGRKAEKLEQVRQEIQEDGGQASCHIGDIRDEDRVKQLISEVLECYDRIDGLVNNAGGQFPAPLELTSAKGFEAVVRSNLVGGFLMAREAFIQAMKDNGGSIVNISADNVGGMPSMGHSGAARAGMENFTQTAAIEWAPHAVRVNAVAPGYILSSGFDTYDPEFLKALLPGFKETIPLYRLGEEAEVSAAVCFLLSPAAAYITGQTLRVDGGSSLNVASPAWRVGPAIRRNTFNGFHRSKRPEAVAELEAEGKL